MKLITVLINWLVVNACSNLLYIKPVIQSNKDDNKKTLGRSVVGKWFKKIEIEQVKYIAIAEPWKNSNKKSLFTSLNSDSLISKKFNIGLRKFNDFLKG